MKNLLTICAAALALAAIAADTDCGALITTGNIADSAKVEHLTGANAGKAAITINDNSGTANSVTVYNAATVDSALSGKASTGDVAALQTRATALETATNNLTTAVGEALTEAKSYTDAQCSGIQDGLTPVLFNMSTAINNAAAAATNYTDSAVAGCVPTSRKVAGKALTGDVTLSSLSIVGSSTSSYNGSAAASVNQTTQTQTATTQGGTTGKNLTIQVAATSLDMGAYYIKIGSDGKPHLMLRQ